MVHDLRFAPANPARWRLKLVVSCAVAALAACFFALSALASGTTERVSVDSSGNQANDYNDGAAISADGRFVAFISSASNLVPGDTNATYDVFVHDRQTGTTERVSVDSSGNQASSDCCYPAAISADGRYVAFSSPAANLVPGDTNGTLDAFVHDRQTGATERVSVDSSGTQASAPNTRANAISADGRYVTFESEASNLVPGDTGGFTDTFVHDRQTGTTQRVSVDSSGNEADFTSCCSTVSADGRFVAFLSQAGNLAAGDNNFTWDVFVHDRQTGTTELVSADSSGGPANDAARFAAISGDGRYVAFSDFATDLVSGDTNGQLDTFVRDRQTGTTERVDVDSAGNEAASGSGVIDAPAISADGRYVLFSSTSALVPGDTNDAYDVYLHDRQTSGTEWVSVDSDGLYNENRGPTISADGRYVAFLSFGTNLVPDDTNETWDVFVRDRGPGADNSASKEASADDTVSTNASVSPDDPLGTSVTTPVAGTVSINEASTTEPDPSGYSLLGQQVDITAPVASAADPLQLVFLIDASILPAGSDASTLQVFRNGTPVPDCTGAPGTASPDPCVSQRQTLGDGDLELTILTSQASHWNFGLHTAYSFTGFNAPLAKQPPALNTVKAGSTVPAKFSLGGNLGLGVLATGYPRSERIDCATGASLGDEAATAGTLTYDRKAKLYAYSWKTQKAWAGAPGGPCRQLDVRLIDGSHHRVDVKFTR